MAVKVPTMWNNMYIGNMSEPQAELLMQTREQKVIPNLKKMLFNFPLEIIQQSYEEGISIREILKRDNIDYTQYITELRDYQTVGTAFMYLSPRSIIADGCGLGKTAEISALINWLRYKDELSIIESNKLLEELRIAKENGKNTEEIENKLKKLASKPKELTRFLMAVETSALAQVQAELARFTGLNVIAMPSEAPKIRRVIQKTDWTKVDGIVIKHSTLRSDPFSKWLALNIDENGLCKIFNTFILDESSVIKNDTSKIYNYTRNICQIVPRVHFMNATTFETSIMDVYNQMDMMDESLLPKKWRIQNEYCTFKRTSYWTKENGKAKMNWRHERSGYKNQQVFKDSLRLVYFGRCKADIGMDRPSIYKVYEVEPSNEMSLALEKGYRYSELLNCPSLIPDANIPMNRQSVPKLDRLCNLVENEFADSSVMVYCFHLEAQAKIKEELEKVGRKVVVLNGSCSDEERYTAQRGFNEGTYDTIVTNIKKSLNLYGGDVCIFYSMETNPSKAFQIASRIDRNVDDRIKTFVMLLYKGTDEYKFFTTTVKQRAKDARDLTIDAKTTVDFFFESMMEDELSELNS